MRNHLPAVSLSLLTNLIYYREKVLYFMKVQRKKNEKENI